MLRLMPFILLITCVLAGCVASREATVVQLPEQLSYHYTCTPDAESSSIQTPVVSVVFSSANIAGIQRTAIVGARRSNSLGGLFTTSQGNETSATYVITREDQVTNPTAIKIPFDISNTSGRAFSLEGIVIRAKSDNTKLQFDYPQDVTNTKRLAPGENIRGLLTVSNLDAANDGDTITVSFFETPAEIDDAGAISKRDALACTLAIAKTSESHACNRTTKAERLSWTGPHKNHPNIAPYLPATDR